LNIPKTSPTFFGDTPSPVQAPADIVLEDVTKGYDPKSTSSIVPCAPSASILLPEDIRLLIRYSVFTILNFFISSIPSNQPASYSATSKLKFEGKQASKGRFFLENLVITQNAATTAPISGSPFTVTGETSKTITGLSAGITYYYTVVAKNTNVTSVSSNEIAAPTLATSVSTPLSAENITAFDGKIRFSATAGQVVEVYNAVGQKLISNTTIDGLNTLPVDARGMLVVKVGNQIAKVIL